MSKFDDSKPSTIDYFNTFVTNTDANARFLNVKGDKMRGILDMNRNKITNLKKPTEPNDAVTKGYVDSGMKPVLFSHTTTHPLGSDGKKVYSIVVPDINLNTSVTMDRIIPLITAYGDIYNNVSVIRDPNNVDERPRRDTYFNCQLKCSVTHMSVVNNILRLHAFVIIDYNPGSQNNIIGKSTVCGCIYILPDNNKTDEIEGSE